MGKVEMIDFSEEYLMMVEATCETVDTNDSLAERTLMFMNKLTEPGMRYRGWHTCSCGENSDNIPWTTPMGKETNSLLYHYVRYHRQSIPDIEMVKLHKELENAGL